MYKRAVSRLYSVKTRPLVLKAWLHLRCTTMSVHKHQRSSAPLIPMEEVNLSDPDTGDSATDSDSATVGIRYKNGAGSSSNRFAFVHPFPCGCCPSRLHDQLRMCESEPTETSSHPSCRCHESCPEEGSYRRKAAYRLVAAGVISVFFIVGEVIGKMRREQCV